MANWLDRILANVGLQRRTPQSSITPGTESYQVLWDWINAPLRSSASIDTEVGIKLNTMRRRSRTLALNNPVARQYLALLADNVIGPTGMKLQAQVRNNDGNLNKAINDKIEAGWAEFWQSPFVDGKMAGVQGEQVLLKSIAIDGEVFVRKVIDRSLNRFGFGLQIIDPELVDHTYNRPRSATDNEIRLGIEVDSYGRAVAIHCWDKIPNDINSGAPRERIRIPADQIIHLYDVERSSQTRGITWFNSVGLALDILDGYVEASLVASRTAACAFPVFQHKEMLDDPAKTPAGFNVELNPGKGLTLPQGLELAQFDPKHPNQNFAEFVKGCLRFFSSGMHVSYNALANDLEGVNYSSIRSGLLIERDHWCTLQQWWVAAFRQPVYGAWLNTALLSGALVLDSRDARKFQAVNFQPRGWKWVDPLKDVTAAILAIDNGLGSRDSYLAEQGSDFEDICEQLAEEKKIASAAGVDFSAAPTTKQEAQQTETKKNMLRLVAMNLLREESDE